MVNSRRGENVVRGEGNGGFDACKGRGGRGMRRYLDSSRAFSQAITGRATALHPT